MSKATRLMAPFMKCARERRAATLCVYRHFSFGQRKVALDTFKVYAILYEEMQNLLFALLLYYVNKMNILLC